MHGRPLPPTACAMGGQWGNNVMRQLTISISVQGDTEARLSAAAAAMLAAFDGLVEKLLAPLPPAAAAAPAASAAVPAAVPAANACPSPLTKSAAAYRARQPSLLRRAGSGAGSILGSSGSGSAAAALKLGQLLVRWDELWLEYLDQFVVWKSADASALVSDLVGMAARLEASMRRKVGREGPAGERVAASDDLQALVAQVGGVWWRCGWLWVGGGGVGAWVRGCPHLYIHQY